MKKAILPMMAAGVLVTLVLFFFHNCGPSKFKHQAFPPIGKVVTLEPVTEANPSKELHQYKNIHITFIAGGRTIFYGENAIIKFFSASESDNPIYQFTPQELKDMHEETECSDDVVGYLENPMEGDTLFCNGHLDLTKVDYFVYSRPGKPDRMATSYQIKYTNEGDDVLGLTVGF